MNINTEWIIKEIYRLGDKVQTNTPEKRTLENLALKISEESGELSAEVLKYNGYKSTDVSKIQILNDMKEELVDLIIVALDMANKIGLTEMEFVRLAMKKIEKWDRVHIQKY